MAKDYSQPGLDRAETLRKLVLKKTVAAKKAGAKIRPDKTSLAGDNAQARAMLKAGDTRSTMQKFNDFSGSSLNDNQLTRNLGITGRDPSPEQRANREVQRRANDKLFTNTKTLEALRANNAKKRASGL